jgi:hypothetical protein
MTGKEFAGAGIFIKKVSDLHRSQLVPAIYFSVKIPDLL